MSPPSWSTATKERHRGFRLHGELLKRAVQRLYLILALHVVAEEDHTSEHNAVVTFQELDAAGRTKMALLKGELREHYAEIEEAIVA
jgi:hypothetical protein